MAINTTQKEAAAEPKGTQLDIEATAVDRACKAVRDFQSGKTTAKAVGEALRAVSLAELQWVSLGTRVPRPLLSEMRGN